MSVTIQASGKLRDEFAKLLRVCAEGGTILLTRETLRTALARCAAGDVAAADLTGWANDIELQEQVTYEPGYEGLIADVLFQVSTPEINEPLSQDLCRRLMDEIAG